MYDILHCNSLHFCMLSVPNIGNTYSYIHSYGRKKKKGKTYNKIQKCFVAFGTF